MATELKTKVITGKVRFSYANVFEPKSANDDAEPKYSVALLIPKSDVVTIAAINAAVEAAKELGKASKFGGKVPVGIKLPLRDGDIEKPDDENYAGCYWINASSANKPGIVDADLNKLMDRDDFYSGCYGRASINFYPFNISGNKGVACGLNNLQKLEEGGRLSGGASAEEDFGDMS